MVGNWRNRRALIGKAPLIWKKWRTLPVSFVTITVELSPPRGDWHLLGDRARVLNVECQAQHLRQLKQLPWQILLPVLIPSREPKERRFLTRWCQRELRIT